MAKSPLMTEALPDLLESGLALVFCGTAASKVSARAGAYYANPGNAFWPALWTTGITPRLYHPSEFRDLLTLRIGLTDLAKSSAGVDSELRQSDFQPDQLRHKIDLFQPLIVAFTSKTAWRIWNRRTAASAATYGWQKSRQGNTRFFVLPSPSGAARRYWSVEPWRDLSEEYARLIESW